MYWTAFATCAMIIHWNMSKLHVPRSWKEFRDEYPLPRGFQDHFKRVDQIGIVETPWILSFVLYLLVWTTITAVSAALRLMLFIGTLANIWVTFIFLLLSRAFGRLLRGVMRRFSGIIYTPLELQLKEQLANAKTYSEYVEACQNLDSHFEEILSWKSQEISMDFDYQLLQQETQALRQAQEDEDVMRAIDVSGSLFRRSFGSLNNPNLYSKSYTGTKDVIEKYFAEVEDVIEFIADGDDPSVSVQERLDFFITCKKTLGRTALCLSGGGGHALIHLGVVRALAKQKCLPRVISGSSGGAIAAGYLATLTDEEILAECDDWHLLPSRYENEKIRFLPLFRKQMANLIEFGYQLRPDKFEAVWNRFIGDITFGQAWEKTSRHVSITVTYVPKNGTIGHGVVLNHITAPHVKIASAIVASCSAPGLIEPKQLFTKDRTGKDIPFFPEGVEWIDGAYEADIPIRHLQEQFRVNYSIVSCVNPYTRLLMDSNCNDPMSSQLNVFSQTTRLCASKIQTELQQLVNLKLIPAGWGPLQFWRQNFSGDINIVPDIPNRLLKFLLVQGTQDETKELIEIGERAAWYELPMIKNMVRLESALDVWIDRLHEMKKMDRSSSSSSSLREDGSADGQPKLLRIWSTISNEDFPEE